MTKIAGSTVLVLILFLTLLPAAALAGDWAAWRGPNHDGASDETGLVSTWSTEGENLLWRVDFVGRSTPVVVDGRVCVAGRVGEGVDKQEQVVCFDAETGKLLWERRLNVFLTSVPFPRVGWASLAGDPETGNIYFHGVGGLFVCFDKEGKTLWERSLTEEFGRYSGYGGRTFTPVVDEDLVILGIVTSSWGELVVPRHRYFAFDKHSGQVAWVSTPGGAPADLNTYSTPVVAKIDGKRLLIAGNGDGGVYAMKVRTGEKVWSFSLSKRGLNSSVVVDGNRVYAGHSEENLDAATMGRIVCIDATGTGDVTKTHEVWRHDTFKTGFVTPAIHAGKLYGVDNSANMHALDAGTGELLWEYSLGTVGKGSPVVADGKLFATEVNGAFHIIDISGQTPEQLSLTRLTVGDRHPEIYGSPAIAYRRVYFASEEGLYCLGDRNVPFEVTSRASGDAVRPSSNPAVTLRITPADVDLMVGEELRFKATGFDSEGSSTGEVKVTWNLEGLKGVLNEEGQYKPDNSDEVLTGFIRGRFGELEAKARVRVFPHLPWTEDFESVEEGKYPAHWLGALRKFSAVRLDDGTKVLEKPRIRRGIQRSYVFLGPPQMKDYTMQVDLKGIPDRRRIPDMGLIASRYILSLDGNSQKLSVHSWASEKRMMQAIDFKWQTDIWYTMKLQVDVQEGKAVVLGKVWPRNDDEPLDWTIEASDPHPNRQGSPGLYGQSYANIHYDNLKIASKKQ